MLTYLGTWPTETEVTVDERSLAHTGHHPCPDTQEETPHGCYDGWTYVGFEGKDESGEHVEEIERLPCRRCKADTEEAL
jgi:hypothetical protein